MLIGCVNRGETWVRDMRRSVSHERRCVAPTSVDRRDAPLGAADFWDDRTIFHRIRGARATLLMTSL
jgi:hypothetical protein